MHFIFSILIIFVVFFTSHNIALADSPKVEVEVNHVASIVEKFQERITLFFKFSKEDKFKYQSEGQFQFFYL